MTQPCKQALLSIDEAQDLLGATAINVVDTAPAAPSRLRRLLQGRSNTTGLTPAARTAVLEWRKARQRATAAGLEWLIADQVAGALAYADIAEENAAA